MPAERSSKVDDPAPADPLRPASLDNERRSEAARSARLIAVFLLGCVGFVGPLLHIASVSAGPGAWPAPFLLLFAFWFLLILLIALAVRSRPED
jgi:fatty acid desaturase